MRRGFTCVESPEPAGTACPTAKAASGQEAQLHSSRKLGAAKTRGFTRVESPKRPRAAVPPASKPEAAMTCGFTLLEMLVATLIMGIAVVGLLGGLAGATRNASRLMDHDRAVQLARAKMNELIATRELPEGAEFGGEFDPREAGGLEAGWRARAGVFARPRSIEGFFTVDRIELEVWWKRGRDRRAFALNGYRTRRALAQDFAPQGSTPQEAQ